MKIENDANLPAPVFRALSYDGYDAPKEAYDISVTELISAPRRVELKRRHAKEIVVAASTRVWSLLGSAIHYILQKLETDECVVEQRFYINVAGWIVTGQTDLYEISRKLSDFKVSGVFTFQRGDRDEHLTQLNMNALCFRLNGYKVDSIQIIAILRDWMRAKAEASEAYPQTAIFVKPYELWSQEKQLFFATQRVKLHQEARALPDDELPPCTDEERWYRGEAFCVKGEGNAKASPGGTFTTETHGAEAKTKARAMAAEMTAKNTDAKSGKIKKRYDVEHRPGLPVRCLKYCEAAPFCNQHQAWLKANPEYAAEAVED